MRIAVVTPLFPVPGHENRGQPIYFTVRALSKLAEVRVFCPMIYYPRWTKRLGNVNFIHARAPERGYRLPGVEAEYFEYTGIPVLSRPVNGFSSGRAAMSRVREFKPGLILNYWLYPEGFGALRIGKRLRTPVVVGSRGSDLLRIQDALTRRFTQRTVSEATAVLTVTDELRRKAIEFGAEPANVHTIPNGCDTTIFHPRSRSEARAALGVSEDARLIVFTGWLSPTKGVPELIEAFKAVRAQHAEARLALVGEGDARVAFERDIAAAGLGEVVMFPGRRQAPEVALWMAAADVFTLPSHSEGCPNVVVEALCCGRPVVATTVGGIPDLVGPDCGLLVPRKDPARLAAALQEALIKPWDESAIARKVARTWDDVAKETLRVCEDAAARGTNV